MALSYISQSYIGFVAVINEIYAQTIFIESNACKIDQKCIKYNTHNLESRSCGPHIQKQGTCI